MKKVFLCSAGCLVIPRIADLIDRESIKRVLFVYTAAEAEEGDWPWVTADREVLISEGFQVTDYTFTGKSAAEIDSAVDSCDVLYIAGGNTFFLLEKIQQAGCADIIFRQISEGKIYIGSSAGCVIAGPDIYPTYNAEDVKKAPLLNGYCGLGLVDFVPLPHWGNSHYREFYLGKRMPLAYSIQHKFLLLRDEQFVFAEDINYRIIQENTN